jgi:hypothetical protein
MSKIAQMAREEANAVEGEEGDEHLVDDGNGGMREETPQEREEREAAEAEEGDGSGKPEPEHEPEQAKVPPAMTEQQSEREFAKLERKAQTYLEGALDIARKLEIPVVPCPLCTFPGLAIPRQAHEVTSDIEGPILALIGKGVEPDYKPSQAYARCEVCDGWGDVLTGAQKDVSRTAMCVTCGGKGYVNQVQPLPQPSPQNGAPLPGIVPLPTAGYEQPRPEPYYDYGERQWKLPPQPIGG